MPNLTSLYKMVVQTDWKQREGYDIVQIQDSHGEIKSKIFTFGQRLPLIKNKPGYRVSRKSISVPFEQEVVSLNGLIYQVKVDLVCECRKSDIVAEQFHGDEDSLSLLIERKKQNLNNKAKTMPELDEDSCREVLVQPLIGEEVSVKELNNIRIIDKSKQFAFWLHVDDDITFSPVNSHVVKKTKIRLVNSNRSETSRSVDDNTSGRVRVLGSDEGQKSGKIKILTGGPQENPVQSSQGIFDKPGLELTSGIQETYEVWVEVRGRTGSESNDNIRQLRTKIADYLKVFAEKFDTFLSKGRIINAVLETPRPDDFSSVIDAVDVPREPRLTYRAVELHLGRSDLPLQLKAGEGIIIEIEAKISYLTQLRTSPGEEVELYFKEQLQMAVGGGQLQSEEHIRWFIKELNLEEEYKLRFNGIRYIRFDKRMQSEEISLETTLRSRDGFFCRLHAALDCLVIREEWNGADRFKTHLVGELTKYFRTVTGIPKVEECESLIQEEGRKELYGFFVNTVLVTIENVTHSITVILGKEESDSYFLRTNTGHSYYLENVAVYCRGSGNNENSDNEKIVNLIRARLESILIKEAGDINGPLTPVMVQEIIEKIGFIEGLDITVATATLPELNDYNKFFNLSVQVELETANSKGYLLEGIIDGYTIAIDIFEKERLINGLSSYLKMKAENSQSHYLSLEECDKWIRDFPGYRDQSFVLSNLSVTITPTKETRILYLDIDHESIAVNAKNGETYHIRGSITYIDEKAQKIDEPALTKVIIEELKGFVRQHNIIKNDPDDSNCEEIVKHIFNRNEYRGITWVKQNIEILNAAKAEETRVITERNKAMRKIAYETYEDGLKRLVDRDNILYDHNKKVLNMLLERDRTELEGLIKDKESLYLQLINEEITQESYDKKNAIINNRENEILKRREKVELSVPSDEIKRIQEEQLSISFKGYNHGESDSGMLEHDKSNESDYSENSNADKHQEHAGTIKK